ncbi:Hypothetical protein SCF082_LOCUS31188 [Durusdinium trenchii]|uniref:Uncharacterized protein n=1 Tax=Durusdinium trenchii TaxID=1381693 RepID=A0ABP0N448_9DINO
MIDYNEDWLFATVFRLDGSVALRSTLFALPAVLFSLLLMYMDEFVEDFRDDMGLANLASSQIWNASTVVLVFLLGFRARQGLARFWEGTGLLHQMRGEWFDTVSNCVTFSISARPSRPQEVMTFRHTLVRLMSLCHGSALEEISGDVVELRVIDVMGLDSTTLHHLWECSEVHKFNRVEVCLHLLQTLITKALDDGVLKIPPPILSRVYQTISRGFVNLLNTKKITDTKFPFPFAQIIAHFLLLHLIMSPALITASVPHKVFAPILTFLAVFSMFALNFISIELENPFGLDANDLPLSEFQKEMNDCLLMLLHPNTDLVSGLDPKGITSFKQLYEEINPSDPEESKQRGKRLWSVREMAKVAHDEDEEDDTGDRTSIDGAQVGPQPQQVQLPAVPTSEPVPLNPEPKVEDLAPMLAKSMEEFNQSLKQWTSMLQSQVADVNKVYKALSVCGERLPRLMQAAEAENENAAASKPNGFTCAKIMNWAAGKVNQEPHPSMSKSKALNQKGCDDGAPITAFLLAWLLPLATLAQAVLVNQYFWHSLRLGAIVRGAMAAALFRSAFQVMLLFLKHPQTQQHFCQTCVSSGSAKPSWLKIWLTRVNLIASFEDAQATLKVVRLTGRTGPLDGALALLVARREGAWVVRPMGSRSVVPVKKEQLRVARSLSHAALLGLVLATVISVLLVAVALQAGPNSKLRAAVPIASLAWYLATLSSCYWLHAPLLADGVLVPAISEMGISASGRFMYQVGFGFCGFLLAITLLQVHLLFNKYHPGLGCTGLYSGLLASAGISLQGVCTLRLQFGLETLAHFLGAMITMVGAVSHATACNEWFDALPTNSPLLRTGWHGLGLWIRRNLFQQANSHGMMMMFGVPLLLQIGKILGFFAELNVVENCMGILQWLLVASIASFFCSYAFDLL